MCKKIFEKQITLCKLLVMNLMGRYLIIVFISKTLVNCFVYKITLNKT